MGIPFRPSIAAAQEKEGKGLRAVCRVEAQPPGQWDTPREPWSKRTQIDPTLCRAAYGLHTSSSFEAVFVETGSRSVVGTDALHGGRSHARTDPSADGRDVR